MIAFLLRTLPFQNLIMKNLFLLGFLFLIFSCSNESGSNAAPQSNYEISGKIVNAGASMPIYLDKLSYYGNQTLDTAILANDGSFAMKGKKNLQRGIYSLRVTPEKSWILIAGNNDKITLNADFNNPEALDVSGSENKKLNTFLAKVSGLRNSLQQYQNEYMMAQMSGDGNKMANAQNQYTTAVNDYNNTVKAMVDTSSSPLIALFAATMLNMDQYGAYLNEFSNKISAQLPDNDLAKEFVAKVKGETALSMGNKAPEFSLKTAKGEKISLNDVKGKVVLLDFWASWCRPCRIENPNVVRLYNQYKDKGFTVFSVSLDNNLEKWVNAIQQDGLTWPYHGSNLLGWQCPVAQQYKVNSIPNTFLLDKNGNIIGKNLRGVELENKLKELFGS
jgi:peroxiredoxin